MRKLATIRRVKDVSPIEGADLIEKVQIDGWVCVSKRGEFKPNDLACYMEIDSFLPIRPEFEFLRKSSFKALEDGSQGFRLRTVKLRGCLSQGLALPLDLLGLTAVQEGDDVTDILGIKKYEPPVPACLSGEAAGFIPGCIKKTDQERIQNLPEYFSLYKEIEFEVTEKLDGTSMTVFFNDGELGVCGRNINYKESTNNSYWQVANSMDLVNKLRSYGKNIALQGELIGHGIQKNPYKLTDHVFKIFDVWDISKQRHLLCSERAELLEKFGLRVKDDQVPVLVYSEIFKTMSSMDSLLNFAVGESKLWATQREGIVLKSVKLVNDQVISFKVISNKYLLNERD